MSVSIKNFGITSDGKEVKLLIIENSNGVKAQVTTFGAALQSFYAPDKNGKLDDIVLSYDNVKGFEDDDKYFGATVGRCANRIQGGEFTINNKKYSLAINNGPNHLHGGLKGFDKAVWDIKSTDSNSVTLSHFSPDGEEGYPGNLTVLVTYSLSDNNELSIKYLAESDKDTVVNLTNHSYFNLGGHASGSIVNEVLMLNSDFFTPADETSIPTGELRSVEGTPMDFRTPKVVGKDIDSDYEQIVFGKGYDHNWMLNANGDLSILSAELVDNSTGRKLEMYTDCPAVQVYTANYLDKGLVGKENTRYDFRDGICLETQYVPNAINDKNFKSTLLKAGEKYSHTTIYKVSTL